MEQISNIEKRLWGSADTLRANSNFASNEYFMPVMGLIFLRHAYSRFLKVRDEIIPTLPSRGGVVRELTKEDFSRRGSIYLRLEAQFDMLVSLPEGQSAATALIGAMESIEGDYETLKGLLPKQEYAELDDEVLRQVLRIFNDPALQRADGDVFGRIYEYFLTQFADQKAHDNGEFFTPVSIVETIVNVIEPTRGKVIDPACGSGGMFVQSAHFVEAMKANPNERLTFYGMEKNPTTIRLAKMNLAVHGLEGDIQKAISYYEDPHKDHGPFDYVMANPPFNVDEIDAEKMKDDKRLSFGLPGVNKGGKVSNGNYIWMSFFHSYLSPRGRAGIVMSSQASSAGGKEADVRQALVKTGDVDIMIAIRGNFFYTRTVPCELWFFDKARRPLQSLTSTKNDIGGCDCEALSAPCRVASRWRSRERGGGGRRWWARSALQVDAGGAQLIARSGKRAVKIDRAAQIFAQGHGKAQAHRIQRRPGHTEIGGQPRQRQPGGAPFAQIPGQPRGGLAVILEKR